MKHGSSSEVVKLNAELEKSIADIQILIDGVKEDVQKNFDEFGNIQSIQTERIDKIEDVIKSESQNLKALTNDLNQKFESLKQETSSTIEGSLASVNLFSNTLKQIMDEHGHRLDELGQLKDQVAQLSKMSPEKLREELIGGIRLLGDRVAKAIAEINERIDNFTDEIHAKVHNSDVISNVNAKGVSDQEENDFAALKESRLLDANDFEIVPREAIQRLTELYKKQSSAVKSSIGNHEQKMQDFEQLLKTYDDENTRLIELLDRRVKRNFLISMVAIIFVILFSIVIRII